MQLRADSIPGNIAEIMVSVYEDFLRTPFLVSNFHYSIIVGSFIACQLSYVWGNWYFSRKSRTYRKLSEQDKIEWQTRIASTLHALVAFSIAAYLVLFDQKFNADPVNYRQPWGVIVMAIGVGYFAADFVLIVRYNIQPLAPIIAHHVFAGWGFLAGVSEMGKCLWFGVYLLITEGSTPFNNIYWILEKCGLASTRLGRAVGKLFALSWLMFRILINPFLIYKVYISWPQMLLMRPYFFLILFVNMFFLISMNTVYFIIGPFRKLAFAKATTVAEVEKVRTD
eukprot:TRINITY_DN793_c0_g5_i1.p1 TRINITY_DN793_c0_g5~~TRINITY_DN793_c0_g5_i1.p1  ORF type:complete len:282 (-),score=95.54 TRINITY_DN793_c0_g5_i1:197-1042(-)